MKKKQYMMMAAFLCTTTTFMAAPVSINTNQSYNSKNVTNGRSCTIGN